METKDFRQMSDYPVEITEGAVTAMLEECGVDFLTAPFHMRLRIKDLLPWRVGCRFDVVDHKHYDEFRLNVYLPAWGADEEYLTLLNGRARHLMTHMAQFRAYYAINGHNLTDSDAAMIDAMETEANMAASTGTSALLTTESSLT
jgi:hypothetical protein